MSKITNKIVTFSAVAAAALMITGALGSSVLNLATAQGINQAIDRVQQTAEGVVAANVNVGANVAVDVSDNNVAACVIVSECPIDQS
jgi:hypothetical protein